MKRRVVLVVLCFTLFSKLGYGQNTYLDSLKIPENPTKEEIGAILDSIKTITYNAYYEGNYAELLRYTNRGLELSRKYNNPEIEIVFLRRQASYFRQINDSVKAKKKYDQAMVIAKMLKDSSAIFSIHNGFGHYYFGLPNYEKAIAHFEKGMSFLGERDTVNNFLGNASLYDVHRSNGSPDKTVERYIKKMEDYVPGLLNTPKAWYHYYANAQFDLDRDRVKKAIPAIKKSIEQAEKANYNKGAIISYELYVETLAALGDYKSAYDVQQHLDSLNSEFFKIEKEKAVNEIITKMDLEQYQQELKAKQLESELNDQRANKNRMLNYISIGASLLMCLLFSWVWTLSKRRQELVETLKKSNLQYLEAKKKAEELSKVKTKFLATMSHELRTPLYGIIGLSAILQHEVKLGEFKEDINSLKFSADYLLSLVNDLLLLSKLDSKQQTTLDKHPFQLRELVMNIVKSLEFMREKNNNVFDVEIDEQIPRFLKGDVIKLSQILMNLISNACKFTEEGNIKIIIGLESLGYDHLRLNFVIADNGLGISEEKQKVIFDEFTQDKRSSKFQGTGLGLSIVKKLLDLHDATISLKSERNKGTEFRFSIAYSIPETHEIDSIDDHNALDEKINGGHILVVDDNKINRLVTRKILEGNGYECKMAINGLEAVEAVGKTYFDLVLMDLNMPVLNGIDATKEIRKFNKFLPIVALTAATPEDMNLDFKLLGMNDVILKPYDPAEFLETVKRNIVAPMKV